MSIPAINWAIDCPGSPTQKHVLIVLANFADDHGLAWPSTNLLVRATGLTDRSIRNAKKQLKEMGLISDAPERGTSGLRLNLEVTRSEAEPLSVKVERGSTNDRKDVPLPRKDVPPPRKEIPPINNNHHLTTNNHQKKESSQNPSSDLFTDPIAEQPSFQPKATPSTPKLERTPEQDFDEFWAAYPRKEGKGSARKAFEKARRKISQRLLIRCILAWPFAEKLSDRGDFRPHPATWLNNERWLDESVRHELKVTDETPEQREAIAAFNRARDAYIAKISMGVTQSGMKMPVLEDFLAKHAQSTRRDNIAVH